MKKIEELSPFLEMMMVEVLPVFISVFKVKASGCAHYQEIDDEDLFCFCAAILDFITIALAPQHLDEQGDVPETVRLLVIKNIITGKRNFGLYMYYLGGFYKFIESRENEWRRSCLLYASQVLTPKAPLLESPAESLAADIRDYINLAIDNDYDIAPK